MTQWIGFLGDAYPWIRALHIISVIAWMAGLLYLPRLFVYHAEAAPGSDKSETFKVMERRLLRGIMNPAMIASLIFGLLLFVHGGLWAEGWMHAKFALLALLFWSHMAMARWRRLFAADRNTRSRDFYRLANEAPTLLMVGIVLLAVVRPF